MTLTYIENLGKGGFSDVDLVEDKKRNQYARKTFKINQPTPVTPKEEEKFKKRFIVEASFLESINHKNIVKILEKDLSHNPPYYLMPVAEKVLKDELITDKTLGGNSTNMIMDILSGLEELHSIGKYHRDLKPGNILKFKDANNKVYYAISDFGLMRDNSSTLTTVTTHAMQKGSDSYTAPELASDIRLATAQSDIFSIGCILHDIHGTGNRIPFTEIFENTNYGSIIKGCTRIRPDRRFSSINDLREAILSLDESSGPSTSISDVINKILDSKEISKPEAISICNYIDKNIENIEGQEALRKLNIPHIEQIYKHDESKWMILAKNYSDWIRESSFTFNLCDAYAIRLEKFHDLGSIDIKAECTIAMLLMGTRHNRFYVEKKVVKLLDKRIDENLAKRLAIEFRSEKRTFCRAIDHLKQSIRYDISNAHPTINSALKEICK